MARVDELGATGGATVWITGLSGSGKSTIGCALLAELERRGVACVLLESDDLRQGLNTDLGFSKEDRIENVRRIGEVALLFARAGLFALVTIISPFAAGRRAIRTRHEEARAPFVEVFIATPLATCEARDVKGLYAKARRGEVAFFTGVSDPYEPPQAAECVVTTEQHSPQQLAEEILEVLHKATGDARLAARGARRAPLTARVLAAPFD